MFRAGHVYQACCHGHADGGGGARGRPGPRGSRAPHAQATFYALQRTYGFLSPELWKETRYTKSPMQEFTDFLAKPAAGDFKPPGDFPPV